MIKRLCVLALTIIMLALPAWSGFAQEDVHTMRFKEILRTRILEILNAWPAEDQYAIMFFVYPNEAYEHRGYANIPEFQMLYRCESDLQVNHNPYFYPIGDFEARWYPAFWDYDLRTPVIDLYEPKVNADALIDWYEAIGLEQIGYEDPEKMYGDDGVVYIGRGPNGLPELLDVVVQIAQELQNDGTIERKFGRKIPIIFADHEYTWYMFEATREANPNGEADEFIDACVKEGYIW